MHVYMFVIYTVVCSYLYDLCLIIHLYIHIYILCISTYKYCTYIYIIYNIISAYLLYHPGGASSPITSARDGSTIHVQHQINSSRRGSTLYSPLTATRVKSARMSITNKDSYSILQTRNTILNPPTSGAGAGYESPRSYTTTGGTGATGTGGTDLNLTLPYDWDPYIVRRPLPEPDLQRQLDQLESDNKGDYIDINIYKDILTKYINKLSVIIDLELIACCLFGYTPTTPAREGELISKMTLRCQQQAATTGVGGGGGGGVYSKSSEPLGPVGTEWCIIDKVWYDAWKTKVGIISSNLSGKAPPVKKGGKSPEKGALGPITNQV